MKKQKNKLEFIDFKRLIPMQVLIKQHEMFDVCLCNKCYHWIRYIDVTKIKKTIRELGFSVENILTVTCVNAAPCKFRNSLIWSKLKKRGEGRRLCSEYKPICYSGFLAGKIRCLAEKFNLTLNEAVGLYRFSMYPESKLEIKQKIILNEEGKR